LYMARQLFDAGELHVNTGLHTVRYMETINTWVEILSLMHFCITWRVHRCLTACLGSLTLS
jgi:hypothetical protein